MFTFMRVDTEKLSHNSKVTGSNPVPATKQNQGFAEMQALFLLPIANLQDIIP
jgi:hypothetical protein